jgi:hypothetical protein
MFKHGVRDMDDALLPAHCIMLMFQIIVKKQSNLGKWWSSLM